MHFNRGNNLTCIYLCLTLTLSEQSNLAPGSVTVYVYTNVIEFILIAVVQGSNKIQ